MKEVPLSNGDISIVSDIDFDHVSQFNWHVNEDKSGYKRVFRNLSVGGKRKHKRLAREVAARAGLDISRFVIDYKNRNTLDNSRENLRCATNAQNLANSSKCRKTSRRTTPSSRFRGVSWVKKLQKWKAQSTFEGRVVYLGVFSDEVEAAKAYDKFVVGKYGEFTNLNFSRVGP